MASLPRTPKSTPPQLKARAQREAGSGRLRQAIELLEELLVVCKVKLIVHSGGYRTKDLGGAAAPDVLRPDVPVKAGCREFPRTSRCAMQEDGVWREQFLFLELLEL